MNRVAMLHAPCSMLTRYSSIVVVRNVADLADLEVRSDVEEW